MARVSHQILDPKQLAEEPAPAPAPPAPASAPAPAPAQAQAPAPTKDAFAELARKGDPRNLAEGEMRRRMQVAKVVTPLLLAVIERTGTLGKRDGEIEMLRELIDGVPPLLNAMAKRLGLGKTTPTWIMARLAEQAAELMARHWSTTGQVLEPDRGAELVAAAVTVGKHMPFMSEDADEPWVVDEATSLRLTEVSVSERILDAINTFPCGQNDRDRFFRDTMKNIRKLAEDSAEKLVVQKASPRARLHLYQSVLRSVSKIYVTCHLAVARQLKSVPREQRLSYIQERGGWSGLIEGIWRQTALHVGMQMGQVGRRDADMVASRDPRVEQ